MRVLKWSLFAAVFLSLVGASLAQSRANEGGNSLGDILQDIERDLDNLEAEQRRAIILSYTYRHSVKGIEKSEGKRVLNNALRRSPSMARDIKEIELKHFYNAVDKPMRRHAGQPDDAAGSYADKALVGSYASIMLWGPYAELEPGRYVVAYRLKILEARESTDGLDRVGFLDVCHEAVTFSGRRPTAAEMPAGVWHELAVPLDVPKKMAFEFRFWPRGNKVAVDRIYVYRINEPAKPKSVSVMGAAEGTGFYPFEERASVGSFLDARGLEPNGFSLWRRAAKGQMRRVEAFGAERTEAIQMKSGDIIWLSEK